MWKTLAELPAYEWREERHHDGVNQSFARLVFQFGQGLEAVASRMRARVLSALLLDC